jgi:hypothetical protein
MAANGWQRRGIALLVVVVAAARSARAVVLDSLDLASLFSESELAVLVERFETSGPTSAATGIVRKVYKGEHAPNAPILVIPWQADLTCGSGLPGGAAPRALRCVFFLNRQPEGGAFGAIFSGVRAIVEDRVYGVVQEGSGPYVLAPSQRETLTPVEAGKPFTWAEFEKEMTEARERARRVARELESPRDGEAPDRLRPLIAEELRRVFPHGPARGVVTRSELLMKMAGRLADLRELQALWELRGRVPRQTMGQEIEVLAAGGATAAFILERFQDGAPREARDEMLEFLAEHGFQVPNEVRHQVLPRLFAVAAGLPDERRARGYAAIATLYQGLPVAASDPDVARLVEAVRSGEAGAVYHLGGTLLETHPELARSVLPDPLRIFALVTIDHSSLRAVHGRVDLRRFPGGGELRAPVLILERVQPDGTVADRRREPVSLPLGLAPTRAGAVSGSFAAAFPSAPLGGGKWRAFLELTVEAGGAAREWRSAATGFTVVP